MTNVFLYIFFFKNLDVKEIETIATFSRSMFKFERFYLTNVFENYTVFLFNLFYDIVKNQVSVAFPVDYT